MAAQTLETVPEETVLPAATPERVTSDAPKQTKPVIAKNPVRVASGKRLAERNRLAREAKKTSRSTKANCKHNNCATNNTTNTTEQATTLVTIFLGLVV